MTVLDDGGREKAMDSIGVIAAKLRRYLVARAVLGIVTAALYVGWLWIFGIDLLLVWGLLAFLLNFIPTLGSLIAGALPILYAFAPKDPGSALAVGPVSWSSNRSWGTTSIHGCRAVRSRCPRW